MKKRVLSTVLVICMLCALFPASILTASAETFSGSCGEQLAWKLDTETGLLEITGTGEMTGAPWSSYRDSIKSVIIGNGVTSIDGSAFRECISLISVTIPNSVTSIDWFAFYGCTGLTGVTIPDSVTSIGSSAFEGCTSLTDVTIPDSVTSIGHTAFGRCNSLTGIWVAENNPNYSSDEKGLLFNKDKTELLQCPRGYAGDYAIPDSVTNICDSAFWACTGLTDVTIPDSVTGIEGFAFWACTGLTSVTIPDSVTNIGDSAFLYCTGLTSLTIGNGVTSIGISAFDGCDGLKAVYITDIAAWCEINFSDLLSNPLIKARNLYLNGVLVTNLTIPDNVTSIGCYSFCGCGLTSVVIGSSVTSIGKAAFDYCDALTSVTIGNSVTSIGENAFSFCFGLKSVTIPDSVTSIGDFAFGFCDALTNITIPSSVTSIGSSAFLMCSGLTDVYFLGTEEEWNAIEIGSYNEYLTDANIHFVEPHAHSYTPVVTAPTCTEQGYTTHTCTVCGDSYVDSFVDALGHKYENGVCVQCGEKDPNEQPTIEFVDVPQKAWYVEAVNYAVQNGLMNGVGNDQFNPEGSMTRAMLVTVLWRYEGEPEAGKNTFSDVPNGQWYTKAVAWAAENGIVGGVGNNRFDPDGEITREQMATILFRYAEKKGIETGKRGSLNIFSDEKQLSAYAKDAVQWAVAEQIINGSDGKLLPQGSATRAQVATILMRFIENIVK